MPTFHSLAMALALAAAPVAAAPAAADTADTGHTACASCMRPYREYTVEPDARVRALFAAAAAADEARFLRLLDGMEQVDALAIETRSLTAAILSPDPALVEAGRQAVRDMDAETEAALRARHHATLPARARMLERALAAGASVSDIGRYSPLPPLHLAALFGNADIVRILLAHGADPAQREGGAGKDPIEFALDHAFHVRMTHLPALVGPDERARIIQALLAGGAPLPWSWMASLPGGTRGDGRPMADHLLWPRLAALTEGGAVMQALADAGTRPADSSEQASALAHAVRAGNLGGALWLLEHAPRRVAESPFGGHATTDSWTDAAMWAIHEPDPALREALLDRLLRADLDWDARGPQDAAEAVEGAPLRPHHAQVPTNATLLGHAVQRGDGALVERLVALGAPVNPAQERYGPATPLGQAVAAEHPEMVELLLRHGADPLAGGGVDTAPLYMAIRPSAWSYRADDADDAPDRARLRDALRRMLAALGPARIRALDAGGRGHPLRQALTSLRPDPGTIEVLLDAGFSPAKVEGASPGHLFMALPADLSVRLVAAGLPLADAPDGDNSALVAALHAPDALPLVQALLARGADPDARDRMGRSPLDHALGLGRLDLVEALVAAGASPTPGDAAILAVLAMDDSHGPLHDWMATHAHGGLAQYCPDPAAAATPGLMAWLLTVDAAGWQRMRAAGLAGDAAACEARGTSWRALAVAGVRALDFPLGGWMADSVAGRIGMLPASPRDPAFVHSAAALAGLFRVANAGTDLLAPLHGRVDPARAGHYVRAGAHGAGPALRLHADGRFEYGPYPGSADAPTVGEWRVVGDRLLLHGDPAPMPAAPYRLRVVPATAQPPDAGFSVALSLGGQPVHDGRIAAFGDPGRVAVHQYGSIVEAAPFDGPVRHITVQHDGVANGRGVVLEPAEDARGAPHFVIEIDEAAVGSAFRRELRVRGDALDDVSGGPGFRRR